VPVLLKTWISLDMARHLGHPPEPFGTLQIRAFLAVTLPTLRAVGGLRILILSIPLNEAMFAVRGPAPKPAPHLALPAMPRTAAPPTAHSVDPACATPGSATTASEPACRGQVMNSPNSSAPIRQSRPVNVACYRPGARP
jgi:hypothetical protein